MKTKAIHYYITSFQTICKQSSENIVTQCISNCGELLKWGMKWDAANHPLILPLYFCNDFLRVRQVEINKQFLTLVVSRPAEKENREINGLQWLIVESF
jgi:hypothetical protein